MPEFRRDPLTDAWVIIAEERSQRPHDFLPHNDSIDDSEYCPFEPGNEEMTPPEVYAERPPGAKHSEWTLRVVPNKYPALAVEGHLNREGHGLFDRMNGVGAHEVVVETPDHERELPDYSLDQMDRVLRSYQQRMLDLSNDHRFRYILIFKNHGLQAGASLVHPHSQIIALSVTPKRVREQLRTSREHFERKNRCLYCDILDQELERDERIVYAGNDFVVWSPFAARFPFEMWILPREHSHDFAELADNRRRRFGGVLKSTVGKLRQALQNPPYNYLITTAPNTLAFQYEQKRWSTLQEDFHWHLEIIPRITRVAGFEWGTGFYINTTSPEEAARFLREETPNVTY